VEEPLGPGEEGDDGLERRKQELRERMREVRRSIPALDRRRLENEAASRLISLPEVGSARTVMVFDSFGSEISTGPAIHLLRTGGHEVLMPYLREGRMEAAGLGGDDDLVATALGPREPPHPAAVDPASIDVVVVPGLAFDQEGYRVGYGGGHYDRYLPRLGPGTLRVGLCFHQQVVERVPRGPGDERVHVVVTDRETLDCRPSA